MDRERGKQNESKMEVKGKKEEENKLF
jgi:hypothetical protein